MILLKKQICTVYTDGSHSIDPKYPYNAGWACVFTNGSETEIAYSHGNVKTTRCSELSAIHLALSLASECQRMVIKCDDQWLVEKLKERLCRGNISTVNNSLKGYQKLLEDVLALSLKRSISFEWVKGHDHDQYNIIADALAAKARIKSISRVPKLFIAE